jgi:hypothetical protein
MEHEREAARRAAAEAEVRDRNIDRRTGERRRPPGWLERQAQRDGIGTDRRRPANREDGWARILAPFRRRGKV